MTAEWVDGREEGEELQAVLRRKNWERRHEMLW